MKWFLLHIFCPCVENRKPNVVGCGLCLVFFLILARRGEGGTPRRRRGEGPWMKDTGSGEDRCISIRIGNNNGSGMSMTYTFIQQTQLNHCKLSACVSFSSTVYYLLLLISLFKCSCSLWALSLQLQLPFCLSAIAVVKMEVAMHPNFP